METIGNKYYVQCPHCGNGNSLVTDDAKVVKDVDVATLFQRKCCHCGEWVAYKAAWVIAVVAQKPSECSYDAEAIRKVH